jgi:hypothetical protein
MFEHKGPNNFRPVCPVRADRGIRVTSHDAAQIEAHQHHTPSVPAFAAAWRSAIMLQFTVFHQALR